LLDANENAYGPGLHLASLNGTSGTNGTPNGTRPPVKTHEDTYVDFLGLHRYPDPHQTSLKQRLCDLRNTGTHSSTPLTPANFFVGVGSDEAIDGILRCFCAPGQDKILTCPPTYGMYAVSAQVNDIKVIKCPLRTEDFSLDAEKVCDILSSEEGKWIKVVYVCSPGNPTGVLIKKTAVEKVLTHPTWNGVLVVDEAYIDFADDGASLADWVPEWENLIVMQTLSKAFGLAGIRIGTAISSPEIARLLNSFKAPYNVSSPSSAIALSALGREGLGVMRHNRRRILEQRQRLLDEMTKVPGVGRLRGGLDSNFLLVEMLDKPEREGGRASSKRAMEVYEALAEGNGVVVRFRGKEVGCEGCLRITVGTGEEVDRFLKALKAVMSHGMNGDAKTGVNDKAVEELSEGEASSVLA